MRPGTSSRIRDRPVGRRVGDLAGRGAEVPDAA
nr:MAG TPA: hypothetical protein [Caudoviricetes sp.]